MILLTRNNTEYSVSDTRGANLLEYLKTNPPKSKMIDIYGNKQDYVSITNIAEVISDEKYQEKLNRQKGMWQCKDGHWHAKQDGYCNTIKKFDETPSEFSKILAGEKIETCDGNGCVKCRWLVAMRKNMEVLTQTGKWGENAA